MNLPRYRELVSAVLAGQPTACCPVLLWKHHPVADQRADTLAQATLDFQASFDADLVKVSPAATYQLQDHGLQDSWPGDDPIGRRAIANSVVQSPEDWLRLRHLPPEAGMTGQIVQAVRLVRQRLAPEVPVIVTVFNPLFQAVTLAGLPRFQAHLRSAPQAVAAGLDVLQDNTVRLIASLRAAGAEGIFLASQHAMPDTCPEADYARFGLPGDQACLAAAQGLPFNMVHLHGSPVHARLFESLPDGVLHYDAVPGNPDLTTWPAPDRPVASGLPPAFLAGSSSAQAVREHVLRTLEQCRGRRLILSCGCSVPLAVPADRLHAVREAVMAVGCSPRSPGQPQPPDTPCSPA